MFISALQAPMHLPQARLKMASSSSDSGDSHQNPGWPGSQVLGGDWWKGQSSGQPQAGESSATRKPTINAGKKSEPKGGSVNPFSQIFTADPNASGIFMQWGKEASQSVVIKPSNPQIIVIGRAPTPVEYLGYIPGMQIQDSIRGVTLDGPNISRHHASCIPRGKNIVFVNGVPASGEATIDSSRTSTAIPGLTIRVPTFPKLTTKYVGPMPPTKESVKISTNWQPMAAGEEIVLSPRKGKNRLLIRFEEAVKHNDQSVRPSKIFTIKCIGANGIRSTKKNSNPKNTPEES